MKLPRRRAKDVKQLIDAARLVGNVFRVNIVAPAGAHGCLVLGVLKTILLGVLVQCDDLDFVARTFDHRGGTEDSAAQPSGNLGEHWNMYLLIPLGDGGL